MAVLRTDDLVILQGATWGVRWPVHDSHGLPADLTGWAVRAQARVARTSTEVLHEWTFDAGNATIIDSAVSITVEATESSAWTWTSAVFDVELFHPDGRVVRVTQGAIRVDAEITR